MILEMIPGILAGGAALVLLTLGGITLSCTAVVFLISTPLFIIFSPVLVPATLATTLLATGFTASGSFLSTAIGTIKYIMKKRAERDMPKIPGIGQSILAKEEDKKKKKKKRKKEEKKDKEKDKMKKSQKKDNMRDKNTDKMKKARKN